MEPVLIHTKQPISPIRSVNIYDNKIDMVNPTLRMYDKKTQLNQYQSLPKGTQYCECYYNEKVMIHGIIIFTRNNESRPSYQ